MFSLDAQALSMMLSQQLGNDIFVTSGTVFRKKDVQSLIGRLSIIANSKEGGGTLKYRFMDTPILEKLLLYSAEDFPWSPLIESREIYRSRKKPDYTLIDIEGEGIVEIPGTGQISKLGNKLGKVVGYKYGTE